MVVKYKVNEIAKDFGVPNKQIIETLKDIDTSKKYSTMTSVEGLELDLLFDKLSKQASVDNFDDLFASAKPIKKRENVDIPKPEQAKPEQAKSEKKKPEQKKPEKKSEQTKSEQAKPEQTKSEQTKSEQTKPEQTKSEQAKPEKKDAFEGVGARIIERASDRKKKVQAQQPEKKRQNQPAQGQSRQAQQGQNQQRRQPQQTQQAQPQRPQEQQTQQPVVKKEKGKSQQPKQPKVQKPQKQAEKRPEMTTIRPGAQKQVQGAVIVQSADENLGSQKAGRVVDMRSGEINADKYDTRYDDLAHAKSGRSSEQSISKQKINQKSQQYRKNGKAGKMTKKESERERRERLALERKLKPITVTIPDEITVGELASRMKIQAGEVIKKLMMMGVMAGINEVIDFDTAYLVATELHAKVEKEVVVTIEERIIDDSEDSDENLVPRSPVVVVMGHVDHGKTSLLDYIRNAHVTAGEAGGITQHIGAYRVPIQDREITFLDTPGHEAFTTMRARGAQVTDVAVLVVAADDGVMPQTVEAINHAKAAGVSIIVAINKMDREGANPMAVMQQLTEYELVPEEWGGDVICVPVSAKTGMGIDDLLENIILVADMRELKANPNRRAKGTVIEARLDKGRGPIATVLVQNGTLHDHDIIVAGTAVGRIRAMTNDKGEKVESAGPSIPVEIIGLDSVPSGGDIFNAVEDEKLARELVEQRRNDIKEEVFQSQTKVTLDNLFSQMQEGEMKELKIIIKADVQGSVEAVRQSLERLSNEEVRVHVIHGAVGAVSESDVMLADASNAIIVGFNVRPDPMAQANAELRGVDMRLYRIIYDCIEEIESALKGMLAPKTRVVDLGRAEVRQTIHISSVGTIAGSYVVSGKIERHALIRVVRDGIVIAEDEIKSLKRFKDDVKEVQQGFECGIGLNKYNDIKEGDFLEAFIIEEYRD